MSDIAAKLSPNRLRAIDYAIAAAVTIGYAGVWALLPADWSEAHVGGKPFLLAFVATAGLAALLASNTLLRRGVTLRETPATLLLVQLLFWNPVAFRAVFAAAEGAGMVGLFPWGAALAGLVALGLPTSLFGAGTCGDRWWVVVYATRVLQCFFASWVPMIPGVVFLHLLLIAQVVTGAKYGGRQKLAFSLVLAEQVLAFLWVFLYCRFE